MDPVTIITLATPFALRLLDGIASGITAALGKAAGDARAAQQAEQTAQKLLRDVYRELKANLNHADSLAHGAFSGLDASGPALRAFAAGFSLAAMSAFLDHAAGGFRPGRGGHAALADLEKAVRLTEDLQRRTAAAPELAAIQRKIRPALRIKNIKAAHLAAYRVLFKA
jgi:hypothetical protein